jgi:RHS repeat-associated protein
VAGTTNPDGIGFTGHVNDPDTGLVYMQQRYYDPVAGRFLSVDPVTTDADNGALFNRYMYAANNPFTLFDPDGRCTGSRITNSDGTCKSTGGFTTGTDGMAQGMQRERAQAAQAPAGAANAPGGPQIGPTWEEIGAVADGVATAASVTPLGMPFRAAKVVGILAKDGAKITGLTRHGVDRVIGDGAQRAGTKPAAIVDALRNPTKVKEGVDNLGRPFKVYTGENARVVVNPETGRIISTKPLSGAGGHKP